MNLTTHFTLDELIASPTAERNGIDNAPDTEALRNLYELCGMLEQIRAMCGHHPVLVSSGYRSPGLNRLIGGSERSAHMEGRAADFTIPGFGSPRDVAERIILSDLDYDQVIWEGSWVHLAISDQPRRQALTATFTDGKAHYTSWVA